MADGRIADAASGVVIRRIICALALVVWTGTALAQTIAEVNQRALAAYNAGDLEGALALTLMVTEAGDAAGRADPAAYLEALNNLTFLRSANVGTAPADRALAFAEDTRQLASTVGLTALRYAAVAHAQVENRVVAATLRNRLLDIARGTPAHGPIVAAAVDLAFQNHDYEALPALIEEMIAVTGGYTAQTTIDALFARQEMLEKQGDVTGVTALVDSRILVVSAVQPDLLDEFSHAALWQKFYMNYEAGSFSAAAESLRNWAATGTLSADEVAFVETQARDSLQLNQLGAYAEQAGVRLGYAELSLAFAEIAYAPDDPRIGLALRELAYAHGQLGQYEIAAETLQAAILNQTKTKEGQLSVFLLLEDLASNAWQRGDLEQAHQLFAQAQSAQHIAIAAQAEPLGPMDKSITALNRARLETERGEFATAEDWLRRARSSYADFVDSGVAKTNDFRHDVSIAQAEAQLALARGHAGQAVTKALALANVARARYPQVHPARAQSLANAADQLFVLGEDDAARALLVEAQEIAAKALPDEAPLNTEIALKLALDAMTVGDRGLAIDHFRKVAAARRAPANRANLAQAADNFEMYAWAVLDVPKPSEATVNEALAALQWTQTTQSAEAYAMMAARLQAQDPSIAGLIRARQDALSALDGNRVELNKAYAAGEAVEGILTRQTELQAALVESDAALNSAGVGLTGQAAISPLDLANIQAHLAPDEVLVTFLLPGLVPEAVADLDGSSNLTIAIRSDDYAIAKIQEHSRGALNRKIDAFRCEMAIGDPGCGATVTAQLRGAMTLDEGDASKPNFDFDLAYGLYRDLFGGIDDVLREDDHLIIVPPGDLLRVPFSALVTEPRVTGLADAAWLIRRNAVSVLPSFAAFAALKGLSEADDSDELSFLGIGDPVIGSAPDMNCDAMSLAALRSAGGADPGLYASKRVNGVRLADVDQLRQMSRLPDATCELQAIEAAVGAGRANVLTREAASETTLKRLDAAGLLQDYDLLVFATHGVIAGETSAVAPGLVLTPPAQAELHDDGLLTAAEVATLDLSARLVILSACNTAAGRSARDEGLSGLASGFFHAGARSLMVTHWAVYSDASAFVSARVSQSVIADGQQSSARALQQVIVGLLEDANMADRTKHPAYWAPFGIIGL